jgi:hypothetical protein
VPFANADVALTLRSNTADVIPGSPPISFLNAGPMTASINGGPAAAFTDQMAIFVDQTAFVVGFVDLTLGDVVLAVESNPFATYDLKTSLGPIIGLFTVNPATGFPTSDGLLALAGAGLASFTASAVPEPSALAIFAVMLAGLIRRRRHSRTAPASAGL